MLLGAYLYFMIKLRLKRKISGKAIKSAERKKQLEKEYKEIKWEKSQKWMKEISKLRKHIRKKGIPLYYHTKNISPYRTKQMAKEFIKQGKMGRLRRLYKLCPEIDPKVIREKEHQAKIDAWQRRIKGLPPF